MTPHISMSATERRAMSDAMRHMHGAGVRRIDLKQTSRLTHRQVHQAITFVILPGRDDIGGMPPPTGVVSPRHVSSSLVSGDDLPVVNFAGRSVADGRLVLRPDLGLGAPAVFQGDAVGRDCVSEGGAGLIGGEALGHADQMSRHSSACHGAAMGRRAP